tara:strand:+ start:457 stop:1230 length:774 start_codon:yes stop_codon:yes gene_type:complete
MEELKEQKTETTPKWEMKDRNYYLSNNKEPLTFKLGSRHTSRHPLLWFDPEKGYERELRYASNKRTPFADEQEGPVTLEHIIFKNGVLSVPKEKVALQQLLSLYHPGRNRLYKEHDVVEVAKDELVDLELEIEAMNAAYTIDIDQAEAILRVEQGSSVSKMSSKEIKRDILLFAKSNPKMFIALANDENVVLRNFAIKATETGIIKLADDQRTFKWGTNGRKLMTVPFDENPYSAMASFFKTDEGLEIYRSIEKKLS